MSKLNYLITELCPDGVEYKALGEVCHYSKSRIDADAVDETSYVGVDNLLPDKRGKTLSSYVPEEGRLTQFAIGDVLIGNIRPYLRKIWRADCEGGTNGDVLVIRINEENLNSVSSEYLYYVLSSEQFFVYNIQNSRGAKMPRGNKDAIMQFFFPLPPLPLQRKIVKILDNFTLLTAELTAELTARKKQYEYYRNQLLTFGYDIEWSKLNEVGIMKRGTYITKENTVPGNIPVILGGQEPAYYCDTSNHDGEAIVISRSGAYAGFVSFWNQPIFVTDGFILETKDRLLIRYLYYYLKNMQGSLHEMKRGGGVPHVRGNEIMEIKVPLPPLEEQARIVAILDKFDTLTTDISSGLPAEIEARRKQYEYYRDKLLTFKEVGA
ncbi:restriction endonuclease subunit S [Cohnella silvisoli]|uniref:Restriction endonuclease subunit S n=1 Tax=Cohnella silvisoli TaxID=2873699 RepID=A0ABV1KLW2_9BACL|nr:restriction endonuclease subunit S [Cohnella silvisoli]MCD9020579.1 restriction endonuclease subunit S [Cohnella silvisoli]